MPPDLDATANPASGRRRFAVLLAPLLAAALLAAAQPAEKTGDPPPEVGAAGGAREGESLAEALGRLPPRYRDWVVAVRGLITQAELEHFLSLREDYRRDAFIEAFWRVRDPEPLTRENELRERWQRAVNSGVGAPFDDPRFVVYLLNGPPGRYSLPNGQPVDRCFSRSRELEIWFYGGSERTDREFVVVFQRRGSNVPYEVYHLGDPVRPLPRTGGLPSQEIRSLCADELLRYALSEIARTPNYERLLETVTSPPRPSPEWIANLSATTTDLPEDAETFAVEAELAFPDRRQSRTAVRVMLRVPLVEAPGEEFGGQLFHNFLVIGEVVRNGGLFESFRYRFEGPTPEGTEAIPLGFTRYLRPGPATLRILIEDVFSGRFAQVVREIEVPSPEGLPVAPDSTTLADLDAGADAGVGPALRLLPPPGDVHAGLVRFNTRAIGTFDEVTFYLDGRATLTKRRPPYSVELDLGSVPKPHRVRVVGFIGGREAATDQIWLNQGAQRFEVRMIEPRPGGIYPGSLTARVEVQTPDGEPPERLELFLNEEPAAILTEPPFVRSLRLPGPRPTVVRAVAYLADGSSAEDAVIVNAADLVEEVEVRLVELYPLVVDDRGRPITGLGEDDFRVLEDGVEQQIQRFAATSDAPIHAALLIDRSASMDPHLDRVVAAARAFARTAIRSPEDRLAVLSFADLLSVDAGFTAETAGVERALAGLVATGGTALYDSLAQSLSLFDGIRGQQALLIFSDGRDENSRLEYEQALEAARRAGVTLYSIGLEEAFPDKAARRILEELTAETGGRAFFIAALDQLPAIYDLILGELRSRYLLAYQPSGSPAGSEFRQIRVEVDRKGAEVRHRQGYYP